MANVPIYTEQGGTRMVVGEGATLVIEGDLEVAGGGDIVLGDDSVTTAMIQDAAVTADKIDVDAVDTESIVAGAVTKATTSMFISELLVGDGMNEDIAHGLGVDPTENNVFVSVVDTLTNTVGDFDASVVSTDATKVVMNVTTGVYYKIMAWAP